jgi:hypothetical protein
MVGTMVPIVYGERDRRRYGVIVAHTTGLLGGSLVLGSATWWASHRLFGTSPIVGGELLLAIAAPAYALHHLGLVRLPIPSVRWQVPARWRGSARHHLLALAYGLGLGVGLLTQVRTASLYFAVMMAALSGSLLTAGLVMAMFGAARAVPLVVFVGRAGSAQTAFALNDAVLRHRAIMATINAAALFTVSGAALSWYVQLVLR